MRQMFLKQDWDGQMELVIQQDILKMEILLDYVILLLDTIFQKKLMKDWN